MPKLVNLSGHKFFRWTVICQADSVKKETHWLCRCDCGQSRSVSGKNLVNGKTKSCGCWNAEVLKNNKNAFIHGFYASHKREMSSYLNMIYRCTVKTHKSWQDYGGRGIVVCDRWMAGFHNFLADMGPRPAGTSIDRINNDGNYEPSNCRWATRIQQRENQRPRLVEVA